MLGKGRVVLWLGALLLPGCYTDFDKGSTTPERPAAKARSRPAPSKEREEKEKKKPKQTYAQAWDVICHAEARANVDPSLGRAERGSRVASWLVENLKNKKARYWFIQFGDTKEEADRRAMFRREARRAGQARCPLERLLFEVVSPQSAPTN